jgi:hypothetical protein
VRQFEVLDELDGVVRHVRDRGWRRAGGCPDAHVVEKDHLAVGGDRVDESRVPIVDVAAEVLQKDDRCSGGSVAEAAVGVVDAVGRRDAEQFRGGEVGCRRHGVVLSLVEPLGRASGDVPSSKACGWTPLPSARGGPASGEPGWLVRVPAAQAAGTRNLVSENRRPFR